jgi:hypothetical protein
MICKLCDTDFTGNKCTRCGLKPGENPIVWPLRSGEYEGWDIERVFKVNPDYLREMLQQEKGTGAQRALIRLLLSQSEAKPTQPAAPKRVQSSAFKFWIFLAAIFFITVIALVIIK